MEQILLPDMLNEDGEEELPETIPPMTTITAPLAGKCNKILL